MKHKIFLSAIIVLALATIFSLSGCAEANHLATDQPDAPGFFSGLFHGFILPVNFVISLFSDNVGIYSVVNNGHWYDGGFVVGVLLDVFGFNSAFWGD